MKPLHICDHIWEVVDWWRMVGLGKDFTKQIIANGDKGILENERPAVIAGLIF
jgi:hypothetical protein